MKNELKCCPFCGGNVRMVIAPLMGTRAFICDKCGADVMFYGAEADTKKQRKDGTGGQAMKVLVACEESQTVCKAFRERGFEAYSCDIQEPSGGHPEWHILGDAVEALRGGYIVTMDMVGHEVGRWDLAICHPPCTDLAVSGARWFPEKQKDFRQQKSVVFFMLMFMANANRIAVENPVCIMSQCYRKPDQIIQPYEFGHPHKKTTCLWLVNLPKLKPTNIVDVTDIKEYTCKNGKKVRFSDWMNHGGSNGESRAKIRSKTFQGIAEAMAEQWGDYILKEQNDEID